MFVGDAVADVQEQAGVEDVDIVGDDAPGGAVEEVDVGDGAEEVGGVVVLLVEPAEEEAVFLGEVVIDAGGVDVVFAIDFLGIEEVVGFFGVLAGLIGEGVEAFVETLGLVSGLLQKIGQINLGAHHRLRAMNWSAPY